MLVTRATLFSLFCAILIAQIFVPPPIGLANNGDFSKVAGLFNLTAPTEDEYQFFVRLWSFDPASHYVAGFASSEQLLAAIAVGINKLFRHDGFFDLRIMGAIHAALYAWAFFLLLPLARAWAIILIPIFAGAMYAEWFNTFYMDTAALIFLALAAVFYLRLVAWRRSADMIGFAVAAALFAASKAQHAALAIPIAALMLLEPAWKKQRQFGVIAAAVVLAGAAIAWRIVPPDYRIGLVYDMIFLEIVPGSPNADRDLVELGLDPSYRNFSGTYIYQPTSPMQRPEFARDFARKTSHARIAAFMARHPIRATALIAHALNPVGKQRSDMGDFERATGRAPFTQSRAVAVWSDLKQKIFENRGWLLLGYAVALSIGAAVSLWSTHFRCGGICLGSMTILAMLITTLGDAVELTRHAFLFNVLLDFLFTAVLFRAVRIFQARPDETGSSKT